MQAKGGDAPRTDFMRVIELTYEVIYIRKPRFKIFFRLAEALSDLFVMAGAAAKSPLGQSRFKASQVATPPVGVEVGGFAVAGVSDMQLHGPTLVFASHAEAAAAQAGLVAADPKLAGKLQVLPALRARRMTIGRYSFLPWMRRGIANEITVPAATTNRAKLTVTLTVSGAATPQPVSKPLEVTGPGDVLGINPQQIIRMHPRPWITDFEPNYLVFVEFYDEDFPWRYTPARGRWRHPPAAALAHSASCSRRASSTGTASRAGRSSRSRSTATSISTTLAPPPPQLFAWAHTQITDAIGSRHDARPRRSSTRCSRRRPRRACRG